MTSLKKRKSGGKITQVVVTLTSDVHTALRQYAEIHRTNSDDAAGMLIREGLDSQNLIENVA